MPLVLNVPTTTPEDGAGQEAVRLLDAQRAAIAHDRVPSREARRAALSRLKELISDNADALCEAAASDLRGRIAADTEWLELAPVTASLRGARQRLGRWMRPRLAAVDPVHLPGRARIIHVPKGIVGIISSPDMPLLSALGPMVAALAAGNRVILLPAEGAPATAVLLQKEIAGYFDTDEVAVLRGGEAMARELAALPLDHLVYAGSAETAPAFGERAAIHGAGFSASPVDAAFAVLCEDYPSEKAAPLFTAGKFLADGNRPHVPDILYVPRGRAREMAGEIMRVLNARHEGEDAPAPNAALPPHPRIDILLRDAENRGAEIYKSRWPTDHGALPTLILNVPHGSMVLSAGDLGPLLPIVEYDILEEVLDRATAHGRPSAAYCFTADRETRTALEKELDTVSVIFNDAIGTPGWEIYQGETGFRLFSRPQRVFTAGPRSLASWLMSRPNDLKRDILKFLSRR